MASKKVLSIHPTDASSNQNIDVADYPAATPTPGTYSLSTITVNNDGYVTAASSGILPDGPTIYTLSNNTGGTLNKGVVVGIRKETSSSNPEIIPASADSATTHYSARGILAENILTGTSGKVQFFGILQFGSWTATDIDKPLFIDLVTDGVLTLTTPTGTGNWSQVCAYIVSTTHILIRIEPATRL